MELPSTLQLVQIYFDTATYDEVERDKKIKTEAQLSLIGGTMGLLTGFSIISGVEIIFFLFRLISSWTFMYYQIMTTIMINHYWVNYSILSLQLSQLLENQEVFDKDNLSESLDVKLHCKMVFQNTQKWLPEHVVI